jgi:hypothetical protein
MNKAHDDLRASLRILEANLGLFHSGTRDVYRTIAVELRKLLCDSPTPLLVRVFGEVSLHKTNLAGLLEEQPSLAEGLLMHVPGGLSRNQNGLPVFQLKFHRSMALVPLKEWLNQPCNNAKITFRELIKSVANKEGAHSDPDYNETLKHTRSFMVGDEFSHPVIICGIAQYLLDFIKNEKSDWCRIAS